MTRGWKVFTHDLRPPLQGGDQPVGRVGCVAWVLTKIARIPRRG